MHWFSRRKEKRVGLALSGGAARGAAHLGVLEVLEREGIRPHCVVGASAGSVVGALYCAGVSVQEMQELALDLHWSKVGRFVRPGLGFFDAQRLEAYVGDLIGQRTFDQLDIPFSAVAVDILANQLVVLREGSVAHAVRASCTFPGIFTPLKKNGRLLVDGGLINNLPVSAARDMGADYVIAVDLLAKPRLETAPRNLVEMWYLTIYTLIRLTHHEAVEADCLIQPEISEFGWVDFAQAGELIEKGREAAEAQIGQIRRDLGL